MNHPLSLRLSFIQPTDFTSAGCPIDCKPLIPKSFARPSSNLSTHDIENAAGGRRQMLLSRVHIQIRIGGMMKQTGVHATWLRCLFRDGSLMSCQLPPVRRLGDAKSLVFQLMYTRSCRQGRRGKMSFNNASMQRGEEENIDATVPRGLFKLRALHNSATYGYGGTITTGLKECWSSM